MHQQYSKDLERRVIYQHEILGFDSTQIAKQLNMSLRVVKGALQRWQEINSVVHDPKTYVEQGGPQLLDTSSVEFLLDLLDRHPDIYIDEISKQFLKQRDMVVSFSTIQRTLKLLGITPKKLSRMAAERLEFGELRGEYLFIVSKETSERLVFADENSVNMFTMYRAMGREYMGQRARRRSYFQQEDRYSILSGLSLDGPIYAEMIPGSFNSATSKLFFTGLLECMNPYPGPKSVLVIDNSAVHVEGVQELYDSRGVKLISLSPYSPDFNPIENCFSLVKEYIRHNGSEFRELVERGEKARIYNFLYDSLSTVTPDKARDCFRRSHY